VSFCPRMAHVGVARVAGVGVEADALVLGVVGVQRLLQACRGPRLAVGNRSLLAKLRWRWPARNPDDQPAQEGENAVADGRGEGLGVARDVGGGFGAGRADFLRFGALVIRIAHFLPFVQQAGIHLANHRGEIKFHLAHLSFLAASGTVCASALKRCSDGAAARLRRVAIRSRECNRRRNGTPRTSRARWISGGCFPGPPRDAGRRRR
jgi:hypothetical protein